ncbi:hypothetical protein [Acuticoccus mangrovi]|uniref:Uncharacterized protein n=1 Tax=Acuticoccus mangrovi TaxID=2796142 RepID=A0A934IRX6_9HYPH|nr:hypothetical protein [Acuticoccus mangrovi]MBJ3777127.1 hypothetical protein [Acuticoccus mangrovi]
MRLPQVAVAGALLAVATGPAATAQPAAKIDPSFAATLTAEVSLFDPAKRTPVDRARSGAPIGITVRLTDPVTGAPITDEHLAGWIRPVAASNSPCREAARSYFVSSGRLPSGATDLDRSLYALRHEDGTVSIVDWEKSIASANILAIARVPGRGGALAARRASYTFLAETSDGPPVAIPAMADTTPHPLAGLGAAHHHILTPTGWLAADRTLETPHGQRLTLPVPVTALVPTFPDSDGIERGVLATLADGTVVPVHADGTAAPAIHGVAATTGAAYAPAAEAAIFVDGTTTLTIDYGRRSRIATSLPAPADRVLVHPDGDFAVAWSDSAPTFSIIEVATGTVTQAVELNAPPTDQPIREVAFAGRSAFALLERLDFVLVVDLAQARRGEPAAVRPVRIGPPVGAVTPDQGPFLIESARGHAGGVVLVLHPDLSAAFPVKEESGNATAAMNGFRVRAGRPVGLAELEGGFEEVAPGRYEAVSIVASGGDHEVVVSGGIGRFSACAAFPVEGGGTAPPAFRLLADEATPGTLRLTIVDTDGNPQRWPAPYRVRLQALGSHWRHMATAVPDGDGHVAHLGASPSGPLVATFAEALPTPIVIAPAQVRRKP